MAWYVALAAAGTALKVAGSISDANSEAGQLKTQAAFEDANANILDQKALTEGAEGARNEEALRREYRRTIGSQMAAAGEGGFNSSGSVWDAVRQSEVYGELDAQNVRYRATTTASGYRQQARNARARSQITRKLASRAKLSGYLKGAGAGLAGASAIGGMGS